MNPIEQFEQLLAAGNDTALLRYSLGNAYLKDDRVAEALPHLARALEHDPDYSAAWKAYARALAESGETAAAITAYEKGIAVAEARGDKQAVREMQVFLRRLQKKSADDSK